MRLIRNALVLSASLIASSSLRPAPAEVISGEFTNWVDVNSEGFPLNPRFIGDGTNSVTGLWSLAQSDDSDDFGQGPDADGGWFYGRGITGGSDIPPDTEVAIASGITDISEITDASIFEFTNGDGTYYTGPAFDAEKEIEIGDFLVFRNIDTGHYGALRIDDIYGCHYNPRVACRMDATWWFQTDGSASFAPPCAGVVCGDSNGSGGVNFDDIDCFVQALIGRDHWIACGADHPGDAFVCANDANGDASVDFNDIDGFVFALINGACP